jgi:hypothetical protein
VLLGNQDLASYPTYGNECCGPSTRERARARSQKHVPFPPPPSSALSKLAERARSRFAHSHSRTSQRQRSSLTGRSVRAVESQPRRHPRAPLPDKGSHPRHHAQSCQHHACQAGPGLDAKKKTIRASEQPEAERVAWRTQAADLPSQDLVEVSETGSPHRYDRLVCLCPTRGARSRQGAPQVWSHHDPYRLDAVGFHGACLCPGWNC